MGVCGNRSHFSNRVTYDWDDVDSCLPSVLTLTVEFLLIYSFPNKPFNRSWTGFSKNVFVLSEYAAIQTEGWHFLMDLILQRMNWLSWNFPEICPMNSIEKIVIYSLLTCSPA